MDPRAVTAQAWRVARVGNRFVRGNVALNTLVQQLGGVGIGDDVPGVTELAAAADFRNAPGCDTGILGDGSLYGGRIANPSQAAGFDQGGTMLPLSMGGDVMGSLQVPGSPVVLLPAAASPAAVLPGSSSSTSASGAGGAGGGAGGAGNGAAAGNPAASSPSSAPGRGVYPGGPGGLSWHWMGSRRSSFARGVTCAPPEVLPMQTVFPIPGAGARASSSAAGAAVPSSALPGSSIALVLIGLGAAALAWAMSGKVK
jgi:hypothetical protein